MSDLNEFLALEVMGYLRHLASDGREYWTLYQNRSDAIRIPISERHPDSDIAQAVECARKLASGDDAMTYSVGGSSRGSYAIIQTGTQVLAQVFFEDAPDQQALALATAVARAAGWTG